MEAIGEDHRQAVDQVGDITGLAAAASVIDLAGDDVVATLHQTSQVRELRLDDLAFAPTGAQLGCLDGREAVEVVLSEDPFELGIHAGPPVRGVMCEL